MTRRVFDGEIAREIAGDDQLRYQRLRAMARSLLDIVRDGLLRDGEVRLHGFGTFRLQRAEARTGRNPRTGERITIPARNRVLFRPAKALRERIEPHRAPTVLAEPEASREALLGAALARGPPWPVPATAGAATARVALSQDETASPRGDGALSREAALADAAGGRARAAGALASAELSAAATEAASAASREARWSGAPPARERVASSSRPAQSASARHQARRTARSAEDIGGVVALPSREATLGESATRATPARATVPATSADERRAPAYRDEAPPAPAGGSGASREAALASGASRERGAGSLPSEAEPDFTVDWDIDMPSHRMGRVAAAADPLNEQAPGGGRGDERSRNRHRGGFWGAVVLVLLLLGLALWWLWPAAERGPRVAEGDGGQPVPSAEEQAAAGGDTATAEQTASSGEATPTTSVGDSAASDSGADEQDQVTETAQEAAPAGEKEQAASAQQSVGGGGDGDAGTSPGEGAAERPLHGVASAGATRTPPAEPILHGMAAAGATRTPPSEAAATQGDQGAAGNGGMPTSADQIEAAGANAAADAEPSASAGSGQPFFEGREYTVQRGDTLWGLADRHYVNPFFWPHIWNNNEDLANPDRISVDQLLWLPTLQGDPTNLTDADRRSIAEGYLQLYRFFKETGDANPGYALVGVRFFDPSVLPDHLRGSAAVKPSTALAATFKARLESRFDAR